MPRWLAAPATRFDWGYGPWLWEPSFLAWRDPVTGLPCVIRRNDHLGNLCGYVGIPEDHPWRLIDRDDINVQVHGGLTFEDRGPDHRYLGFDCAHFMDLAPGLHMLTRRLRPLLDFDAPTLEVYRGLTYVITEVQDLARQLAAA